MIWLFGLETCALAYFLFKRWDNPDDRVALSIGVIILGLATAVALHEGRWYLEKNPMNT